MRGEAGLALQVSIEPFVSSPFRFVNTKNVERGAARGYATKRAVDVVLAGVLLVLFSPLLASVMAVVALGGGHPLFGHERVGRGGRSFRCWKIRTMRRDAETRLAGLLQLDPVCRRQWAADRKLAPDPRATRLGRFLRRTSLDELPQLWNVLVGDMSLVGPRPVTRDELPRYGANAGHYCAVRPGITGAWQVARTARTTYDERVAMDRRYVETSSLLGDAAILLRTLRAPFAPTGVER